MLMSPKAYPMLRRLQYLFLIVFTLQQPWLLLRIHATATYVFLVVVFFLVMLCVRFLDKIKARLVVIIAISNKYSMYSCDSQLVAGRGPGLLSRSSACKQNSVC